MRAVVRIQAWFRGNRARKQFNKDLMYRRISQNKLYENKKFTHVSNGKANKTEKRPIFTYQNGATYEGSWLVGEEEVRHGYGVQIWPDGARYEGQWEFNKANGKGTFWHVHGDKYEGDWLDDKAHGKGVYIHANGAKYDG